MITKRRLTPVSHIQGLSMNMLYLNAGKSKTINTPALYYCP
jgi:hypothetical protein